MLEVWNQAFQPVEPNGFSLCAEVPGMTPSTSSASLAHTVPWSTWRWTLRAPKMGDLEGRWLDIDLFWGIWRMDGDHGVYGSMVSLIYSTSARCLLRLRWLTKVPSPWGSSEVSLLCWSCISATSKSIYTWYAHVYGCGYDGVHGYCLGFCFGGWILRLLMTYGGH